METIKISQKGYILRNYRNLNEIERISYGSYIREFGGDETTTSQGVDSRFYVDGKNLMTWGVRGNSPRIVETFKTKREAVANLYATWECNVYENLEAPYFAKTLNELYDYFADSFGKETKVIKRYFRLQKYFKERARQKKIKFDSRPFTTKEMMIEFVNSNREMIQSSLIELNELKQAENKAEWQVKANALVQKVSNNDFRVLKWKEIYNLIKETV